MMKVSHRGTLFAPTVGWTPMFVAPAYSRPPRRITDEYTPSLGIAIPSPMAMFTVGSPIAVPMRLPPSMTPLTPQRQPSRRSAPSISPSAIRPRMRVDDTASPPMYTGSTTEAVIP